MILTDYLEFRWYLDGELRLSASLPRPGKQQSYPLERRCGIACHAAFRQFIVADIPLKSTPKDLATRMAGLA